MPPSRCGLALPFLEHIADESARFRAALAEAPPGARVPTCPAWDADDLLWHLGEVQWFREEVAQRRLTDAADLEAPEAELWMWAPDHSAGYVQRRQAHEALVHRLDAELTVGARSRMDCRLAADGVDEALRVMRGHQPEPGLSQEPLAGTVRTPLPRPSSAVRPPTSTAGCGSDRARPRHDAGGDPRQLNRLRSRGPPG